jgi:hypothetical protein
MSRDYYRDLEIKRDSTESEIAKAYYKTINHKLSSTILKMASKAFKRGFQHKF